MAEGGEAARREPPAPQPAPVRRDSALYLWLLARSWRCALLLTLCFLVFGALSLDLARLLLANARFLAEHGWLAVQDAALLQLLELFFKAVAAMAGYTGFKLCEHALVQRLAHHAGEPGKRRR